MKSILLHSCKELFLFYDLTREEQYNKTLNHKSGENNKGLSNTDTKSFLLFEAWTPTHEG